MMPVRILIADDNKEYSELLSALISLNDDIEVVGIAKNGTQTVEMLLQTKPDVLLLDIVMPEMDGLEVLRKIMKDNAPVVFIISATSNEKIAKQALTLGARYFFVKPLDSQALVSKIRKVIEK